MSTTFDSALAGRCGFVFVFICVGLALAWLSWSLFDLQASGVLASDFSEHARFTAEALAGKAPWPPHRGLHVTVAGLHRLTGLSLAAAMAAVLTACKVLTFGVVFVVATKFFGLGRIAAMGVSLASFIAHPVPFPGYNRYLGQATANVWHNPTFIAAQPFVLIAFFSYALSFELRAATDVAPTPRWSVARLRALGGVALVLSVAFKPNFAIAFLPALCLLASVSALGEAHAETRGASSSLGQRSMGRLRDAARALVRANVGIGLSVAPTIYLLVWEAVVLRTADGGFDFAPFDVWRRYSPNPAGSTALSFAFPLALACFGGCRRLRTPTFFLAWATVAVALIQFATLAEVGVRRYHGNWGWGLLSAAGVVFAASFLSCARDWGSLGPFVRVVFVVIALAHVVSGIAYAVSLFGGTYV